jgi:hypothetical protein
MTDQLINTETPTGVERVLINCSGRQLAGSAVHSASRRCLVVR